MDQTPNPSAARKLLKAFMRANGLSTAQFARAIGRSAPAVGGYLDGDIPAESTRQAIERYAGIPAGLWGQTAREKAEARVLARVVPHASRMNTAA